MDNAGGRKLSLFFRKIGTDDFEQIKRLHEELFPVKYSDTFFRNICTGSLQGGELFSSIAVDISTNLIIGFILAQILTRDRCEDKDLYVSSNPEDKVCYILTIGLKEAYRKSGLGSTLVQQCVHYSEQIQDCGAVYLHVIDYNVAAIRLYQRNKFEWLKTLHGFYKIKGEYYTAYLYIYCVNGHRPYLFYRMLNSTRKLADAGSQKLIGWFSFFLDKIMSVAPRNHSPRLAHNHSNNTSSGDTSRISDSNNNNNKNINGSGSLHKIQLDGDLSRLDERRGAINRSDNATNFNSSSNSSSSSSRNGNNNRDDNRDITIVNDGIDNGNCAPCSAPPSYVHDFERRLDERLCGSHSLDIMEVAGGSRSGEVIYDSYS